MNTNALRQKILDLAIHGKLVKQDPADESAAVLLEKIRAEKERKIASGELKRDKNDSYIFIGDDNRHYEKFTDGCVKDIEDEIPFAVPDGWVWCRLGEICFIVMGQSPESSSISNNSAGMEFHQGKIYFTEKYIQKTDNYTSNITKIAPKNAILLCVRAPVGIVNITEREICIGRGLCAIYPKYKIQSEFWFYWLQCQKDIFEQKATGTTFKAISIEIIKNTLVPLPPLAEQQRIVAKIEAIFAQIDLMEQNKADLQTAVKQAKSKILDLAIRGKLVPQDPADEPASLMLEKLRVEKEAKIAAGEIKRGKNDSYIYKNSTDNCYYQKYTDGHEEDISDEIPFDIPDGWAWCRLGEISHELGDGIHGTPEYQQNGNCYFINGNNLSNGKIIIKKDTKTVSEEQYRIYKKNLSSKTMFVSINGTLGNIAFYNNEHIILGKSVCYLNLVNERFKYFFYFLFNSQYFQKYAQESATGSTIKNVSLKAMNNFLISLPPLSEQKRIVAKIEELFAKLDFITTALTE